MPAYLPYVQPDLTPETIAEAQAVLGVELPDAYLAVLHEQNGGYLRLTFPGMVDSTIWGIGPRFPNLVGGQWWRNEPGQHDEDMWRPQHLDKLIAFDGDSHWHLCFDYRNRKAGDDPVITYFDLEMEEDYVLADSFHHYLEQLVENIDENTFGISGKESLDDVIEAQESALGKTIEAIGADANGYPVYRCALETKSNPEWLRLTENEAPRGFVRVDEPEYQLLVGRMPGTALRFPSHAQHKFILEHTDGKDVAQTVAQACEKASLKLTRLR